VEAAAQDGEDEHADHRQRQRLAVLLGEHLVEGELGEERDRALDAAEAEHRHDREDPVRPEVRPEMAEQTAVLLHASAAAGAEQLGGDRRRPPGGAAAPEPPAYLTPLVDAGQAPARAVEG